MRHPGVFWESITAPKKGATGRAGAVARVIENHRITQEIKDWRTDVDAATRTARENTGDALIAPSDSAGFYWAKLMIKHADGPHELKQVSVLTVNAAGTPTGAQVYYRSPTFWKVSASVNLPTAVSRTDYFGINGFDSRCSAYGVALAVLTEMRFPGATATAATSEYPQGYTQARAK